MITTVWKATLTVADEQEIEIQKGAEILHFAEQAGTFCIWYHCDPGAEKEKRTIRIAGTGHLISDKHWRYIGSSFYRGPELVFHAFELLL